jgi:hypothetical protein
MKPVSPDELAQTYSELADEELLRMHASGQLTEVAYDVLEKELVQRGMPVPNRADALAKAIAMRDQRFWSFKTWTASAAFRLILFCWFYSWLGIFVSLAPLAAIPPGGLADVLMMSLWGAGVSTIPFVIYLGIWGWWFWTKEDKTIYTRQLCAIVYAALGIIVPMSAFSAFVSWVAWESFSSQGKLPTGWGQGAGLGFMVLVIFLEPIGLAVGSALGHRRGLALERRGIPLSTKWVIIGTLVIMGTLAFVVLLIIGLVMFDHVTG